MISRNPATGEVLAEFDELGEAEIRQRLDRSAAAFRSWRRAPLAERSAAMHRAAGILEAEKQRLGTLMTLEMGKPIGAAVAEAEKCAWVCRFYADAAEEMLQDQPVDAGDRRCFIRYQPLGPVLAVMPWNFPFWQAFRFIAPTLMAGNTGLLKHASNVPQCALAIEDILLRAGFPEGVFQTLLAGSSAVDGMIRHPAVAAVTLTGSEAAGASVARTAGECIRKSLLELGGSDPFIVMPSADLDAAVRTAVTARTINNGQSCIAAKRFIIADEIYDAFVPAFVDGMRSLRLGDPLDEATQLGPLALDSLRDELHGQVLETVRLGARVLTGGNPIDGAGWFYEPTVLEHIPHDSPAFRDELFGPVALLFRARDIDDALRIANDSRFGLGSSAWTRDAFEQQRFCNELEAGQVFINAMVSSDPRLPFGGIRQSGYGRELGHNGILEFVNVKTVVIEGAGSASQPQTE